MRRHLAFAAFLAVFGAGPFVLAHDGERHAPKAAVEVQPGRGTGAPFPLELDTGFALVDQTGRAVTNADFAGRYLIVFFGFARCNGICPTAYQAMGDAAEILAQEDQDLQPLLITIDPANEPPEVLAVALPALHPRLRGLTGSEEAVAAVMAGFQVEADYQGEDRLRGTPIFSHGSFLYLLGPQSELLTVLPPILSAGQIAEIVKGYLNPPEG